ncbi:TldD/PmbA family protein [Massilia sp. W12]|uniref:TldD/PmbA family protein n=1 Tax=Massilia sp. W12 TaxID=3126507 RepID=UPI0030D03926
MRAHFARLAPEVDFCSLRLFSERQQQTSSRQGVLQPFSTNLERGVMLTVIHQGGYGYAATSDLSEAGIAAAYARARHWAQRSSGRCVTDYSKIQFPQVRGEYRSPDHGRTPLAAKELIALLQAETTAAQVDERIVDSIASMWTVHTDTLFLSNQGSDVRQSFSMVMPTMSVTANDGADTQSRSFGGGGSFYQGDWGAFYDSNFVGSGARLAAEALELLAAPNCPTGQMDLLLMPSQMLLQIHESIGHPLELDRILGDERNYAGTSFVTPDMFGTYQYGSDLLNVSFDPTRREELAAYGWDDDGAPAQKVFLIENGLLQRPLGGLISQQRAGLPGAASARACSWNRPALDRMSNLNVEPGASSMQAMIAQVERGILMDTNVSWSIDDSRNKFQFGCEYGRLIENGELKGVVKNPNYRGISATFWRNLKAVGDASTFQVMGTPFCGKAEPSQVIRCGHAAPACLFAQVEVFGGQE